MHEEPDIHGRIVPRFYALEGLDGAGTTTQAGLIANGGASHVDESSVHVTSEPTKGPVGSLIRSVLGAEVSVTSESLAYLFAADRHDHLFAPEGGILARIAKGQAVVTDRYLFSSLAYQGILCGFDFVRDLNARFPLPEGLFYLDVTTETALRRSADRPNREIFEERSFQRSLHDAYEAALGWAESVGVSVHRIDGAQAATEIHKKISDVIGSPKL